MSALSLLSTSCPSPHGTVKKQARRGAGTRPAQRVSPSQKGRQGSRLRGRASALPWGLLWEPGGLRSWGTLPTHPAHPSHVGPFPLGIDTWAQVRACARARTHTHTHTHTECPAGSGPWKEMMRKKEVGSGLTGPTGGEGTGGGSLLPGRLHFISQLLSACSMKASACVCAQSYLTFCDPMDYSLPGS